jgi:hypothetical protein
MPNISATISDDVYKMLNAYADRHKLPYLTDALEEMIRKAWALDSEVEKGSKVLLERNGAFSVVDLRAKAGVR